jgi:hypothetical protein
MLTLGPVHEDRIPKPLFSQLSLVPSRRQSFKEVLLATQAFLGGSGGYIDAEPIYIVNMFHGKNKQHMIANAPIRQSCLSKAPLVQPPLRTTHSRQSMDLVNVSKEI